MTNGMRQPQSPICGRRQRRVEHVAETAATMIATCWLADCQAT